MVKKSSVTFFIEGQEHLRFVESYILVLRDIGCEITITSLEELKFTEENLDLKVNIVKKNNLREYFKNISGDWVFTTTPGVGSYYFPKSRNQTTKKKIRYVYVFHSLVSPNQVYLEKSFYKFDIILSPNKVISNQLKFLTRKKVQIYTVGYPVLNHYKQKYETSEDTIILVAPSWGKDSFLFNYSFMEALVERLSKLNKKIIIRPHPMHIKKLINDQRLNNLNIEIDTEKNLNYLKDVSLLVTDWSGISLEYFYITNNPVIFIDSIKKKRRKLTKKEDSIELIENKVRDIIGQIVKVEDVVGCNLNLEISQNKKNLKYLSNIYSPEFNYDIVKIKIQKFLTSS
jgi:YidC/Oxa1 family membrane protein insertase